MKGNVVPFARKHARRSPSVFEQQLLHLSRRMAPGQQLILINLARALVDARQARLARIAAEVPHEE